MPVSNPFPPMPTSTRWVQPTLCFPEENTSSGRFVGFGSGFDPVPELEDDGVDIVAFADFTRSTKAPSRGAINADVLAGEALFVTSPP